MRRRKSLALGLVVALWLLAACTRGNDPRPSSAEGHTKAGVAGQLIDFDRSAPAPPISGAVPGGTVTVFVPNDWQTLLDPTGLYFPDVTSVMSGLVTRSLTEYVYDPAQGAMVLVPDIATDTGTPNTDYTQWTFTVRHGVRFEDGTPVTADDVAFGIKRSLDRVDFPDGPPYSADYFLDGAAYTGPYLSGTSYSGVVVDGDVVTIKMNRPFPDLPYYAAFPAIGPVPDIGSNPDTYGLHPLATGPYKFSEYRPERSLTLVRNRYWNPSTDPGRHAYPDSYVFRFGAPAQRIAETVLAKTGVGQTSLSIQSVPAAFYPRAQRLHRLTLGPAPCTFMWYPDYGKITDIRVRKAIGYAYPYQSIARANGWIPGVTALHGAPMLPPEFPGREEFSVLDIPQGRTDAEKAKALLREAGYAPGEYDLRFVYDASDPLAVRVKDLRVRALEAAGFKVSPQGQASVEDALTVQDDAAAPINLRDGGWCSDWPSGSAWFPQLFRSNSDHNDMYFAEPAIEREMARISRSPLEKQPVEWAALDKTLMTRYYPAIILNYIGDAFLHGARIHGMNHDNAYGAPTWKDLNVAR